MGLFLTLVYITYMYATPAQWAPWLLVAPMQMIFGCLAALSSVPRLIGRANSPIRPQIVSGVAPLIGRANSPIAPQIWLCSLFVIALALSPIVQRWVGGVPLAFIHLMPVLGVLFLVWLNCDQGSRRSIFTLCFGGTLLFMLACGVRDYYTRPDDSPFVLVQKSGNSLAEPSYRIRALGIIGDPNDFAQVLLVSLALFGIFWRRNLVVRLVAVVLPGIALLYGVYLTKSRGALVTMALMVVIFARRRLKWFGALPLGGIALLALLASRFVGGREVSLQGGVDRLALWSDGLQLLKHSPLWGVGYGGFADAVGMTAHNSVLLVAAEVGLIGLTLWLSVFIISFIQLSRIIQPPEGSAPDAELKSDARALELALTAYLGTSWFLSRAYAPTPFLLIGMVAALVSEHTRRHPDLVLTPPMTVWLKWSLILGCAALSLIYVMVRLRAV